MNRVLAVALLLPLIVHLSSSLWAASGDEPRMLASYVDVPPIIDGKLTDGSEWSAAAPAQDNWSLLNSVNDESDTTNNRWQAMWDDNGLYVLHQVDYGRWGVDGIAGFTFSYESLQLFFDPNTDDESNDQSQPNDTGPDNYRLAMNQPLGASEITPQNVSAGFLGDTLLNGQSGDLGQPWNGFQNIVMRQTTDRQNSTGLTELFIPWTDFNATNPEAGFDPAMGDDIGLFSPLAPADGDEWFFNIARVQSDGTTASWALASGAADIASRPHGILEFKSETGSGEYERCDVNVDGICDAADIDELSAAVRNLEFELRYDLNEDIRVNDDDRHVWVTRPDFMHTWFGDANLDGEFNSNDLVLIFQAGTYEDGIPGNSGWAEGDWNGDADFGTSDLVLAFQEAGYELGPRAIVSAVPEPNACLLILLGMLALLSKSARRNA